MKNALFAAVICAAALLSQQKPDLGNRALRGPLVWILDASGVSVAANLDLATLAIDPPGTAGGRPTLRAILPAQPPSAAALHCTETTYSGSGAIVLPKSPVGNVLVFWGPLRQRVSSGAFTVSGASITLSADFKAGDPIDVCAFY